MSQSPSIGKHIPVLGGIRILNAMTVDNPGTLGCVCASGDGTLWLLSCRHVLVRPRKWDGVPFMAGEPILQPGPPSEENRIGTTVEDRQNPDLDCAAALLAPEIEVLPEVLNIGVIGKPVAAERRMCVIKAGAKTGVTEGMIHKAVGRTITIVPMPGAPSDYELSLPGDSGALWLERDTLSPVALHRSGNREGLQSQEFAKASPIQDVLKALSLEVFHG